MNIGRISGMNYFYHKGQIQQTALSGIARHIQTQTMQRNRDIVTIRVGLNNMESENNSLIYRARGQMTRVMDSLKVTENAVSMAIPIEAKYLGEYEKEDYTERDALMYQYMKQYRVDAQIIKNEDGSYSTVCHGNGRIMLEELVSDEELENFRTGLSQNGLREEIDWRGVKEDFSHVKIYTHNVERLELKADYLCSRYSVLKDRIQRQYTGSEQLGQMEILEGLYQKAKKEMADSYAEEFGSFYEYYGQEGMTERFRESLLAVISDRTAAYDSYLAEHSDYAAASTGNEWLLQDDRYLAGQLREDCNVSEKESAAPDGQDGFNMEELMFAGMYKCFLTHRDINLEQELMGDGWNPVLEEDDYAFGIFFAKRYAHVQEFINNADISSEMKALADSIIEPDMNALIDLYNVLREEKFQRCPGLKRIKPIDHNAVYRSYKRALASMGHTEN